MSSPFSPTPGPYVVTYDGAAYPHVASGLEAPDPVTRARFLFLAVPVALPAVVFGPGGPRDTRGGAELRDNARLFAHAWTMLEALREISNDRDAVGFLTDAAFAARAALAGLEGGQ